MTLEKSFQLHLPEPPEHLLTPEKVFAGKPPFGALERDGLELSGELAAEVPLLGEIRFPFKSLIRPEGDDRARLEAVILEPNPPFWAELSGAGRLEGGGIGYELSLRVHAELPQGEKWGGQALRRMAQVAFERSVERVLAQLGQ
ncbi:MAG: DUF3809 family protein [Meiothermus sp.]|nr:DUF3809 family protein [Meiothermus sp.]